MGLNKAFEYLRTLLFWSGLKASANLLSQKGKVRGEYKVAKMPQNV